MVDDQSDCIGTPASDCLLYLSSSHSNEAESISWACA